MKKHQRVTFNQVSDIFEHAIDYLKHVVTLLDGLRERELSDRVEMLLSSYEVEERNLLGALERYVEDADDRLLNTYAQYSVELPAELDGPEEPLSTIALTRWLQGLNQHLVELFRELAGTSRSADQRGAFEAMTRQVESHERKLSKEYQRFEDL